MASFGIGTGATTVPTSAEAGAGVVSGGAIGDERTAAAAATVAALVDARAGAAFGAAIGDDGAAAATAGAIVAGASRDGGGVRADGSIPVGVGLTAARSARAAGLRAFACASNCRAASRVRQYPAP